VLVGVNRGRDIPGWERTFYAAAGIDVCDIEVVDAPVRVARLLSATPMFSMPAYVHPAIVDTWDRVGVALRALASTQSHPLRIFCSRRQERRACTNRDKVEALFAAHGFEIVFPEDLPLPDQVEMYHQADVVAGFAGSGMFTTLLSDRPKHVIVLRSDTYAARNEYMIAAVRGHRLDVVVAKADRSPPYDNPRQASLAPFALDFDAEGSWLRGVLDDL
jgi:capsular polysaccharide biosynthesis protein